MTRTGTSRRAALTLACIGTLLAAPAGAVALTTRSETKPPPPLSTHSKTTTTINSNGHLVATPKCAKGEHVVSGGFKSSDASDPGEAAGSFADGDYAWHVVFAPFGAHKLTAYAYCGPGKSRISTYTGEYSVPAADANTTDTSGTCRPHQTLIGGGYTFAGTRTSNEYNSPTYSDYATKGEWTVTAAFSGIPADLTASDYCQHGVTVKVRSSTSASIPDGGDGSATASCNKGETLLSGGYTTTPTPDYHNTTGPDLFYSASYRSGASSWTASARNYSHAAGNIEVFAYCTP